MFLTWLLARHDGRAFRRLVDREPGAYVEIGLNDQRTASITVPAHQLADARTGAARVHAGRSRLKVYAHPYGTDPEAVLIFNGIIGSPQVDGDRVTLPAIDQSLRLLHASPAPLAAKGEGEITTLGIEVTPGTWAGIDASEMMMQLIELSDARAIELAGGNFPDTPTCGIEAGDLAVTGNDRTYTIPDGPSTWDLIVEESARNRAPDFELEPVDEPTGGSNTHARLNTYYPRQGSDLTDDNDAVILEDGHNAQIVHEPSVIEPGLCNRFVAVGRATGAGAIAPVYVAENRPSIETFGVWQQIDGNTGITDLDRLQRKAESELAARSRVAHHFDVRPALMAGGQARGWARDGNGDPLVDPSDTFQIPPTFLPGHDYWIGDEIKLRSRRFFMGVHKTGNIRSDFKARITRAKFNEIDSAANVGLELETVVEEEAAAIQGYESEIFLGVE